MNLLGIFLNVIALATCVSAQDAVTPYPFKISISSPDTQVHLGNTIRIKIVLENTSDKEIEVPESVSTHNGELSYVISVVSATGAAVPLTEYGKALHGLPTRTFVVIRDSQKPHFLQPHETLIAEATLDKIYKFASPGKFFVQAEKDVNPDVANGSVVKSNILTLTVVKN